MNAHADHVAHMDVRDDQGRMCATIKYMPTRAPSQEGALTYNQENVLYRHQALRFRAKPINEIMPVPNARMLAGSGIIS